MTLRPRIVSAVLAATLALPTTSDAAVLKVGSGQAYADLDSAVTAASDGDTIELGADSFFFGTTIVITKDITIQGAGRTASLVQSTATEALNVSGADVIFRDLGFATSGVRAIKVDFGSVELLGVDVIGAGGDDGAGILADNATVTLNDVKMDGNTATENGGHVHATDSTVAIANSTLDNGVSDHGGALYLTNSTLTVDGTTFSNNLAARSGAHAYGGAIAAFDTDLTVRTSTFTANECEALWSAFRGGHARGGAIHLEGTGSGDILDSTFTSNWTDGTVVSHGGAISGWNATAMNIERSTFSLNSLETPTDVGRGGAVYVSNTPITVSASTFTDNDALSDDIAAGGAIAVWNSDLTVSGSTFDTNTADASRGGGGAINADGDDGTLQLVDVESSDFVDNVGRIGGAIAIQRDDLAIELSTFSTNTSSNEGGAVAWLGRSGASAVVVTSVFDANDASSDGGAVSLSAGDTGAATVTSNQFLANIGAASGGAVAIDDIGTFELAANTLCGNRSVDGAVWVLGGGSGGPSMLTNNIFAANQASGQGGGLWVGLLGDRLTARNNTFVNNSAFEGGALYTADSAMWFTNNIVSSSVGGGWVASVDVTLTAQANYNLYYSNTPNYSGVTVGSNNVNADPQLTGYTGNCATNDYTPATTSPVVDAGDPTVLDGDASRSDIGAQGGPTGAVDADGDGWAAGTDCDDTNVNIYPGAPEVPYDTVDQDCDGSDLCDYDADGYDSASCGGNDCDDVDAARSPGAVEVPYDGIDQDCDSSDLCDVDADGYDHATCGGNDCDDVNAALNPGATEVAYDGIDQDCDSSDLCDVDGDGEDDPSCGGSDCDDDDATIYSAATEVADDGIDQDCDGADLETPADDPKDDDPSDDDPSDDKQDDDAAGKDGEGAGGCGCTSAPASTTLFGWLFAGALLIGRRR